MFKWYFLQQTPKIKVFRNCAVVGSIICRGSVAIKVKNVMIHYFQTKKLLSQGDPIFPILFYIAADMLAAMIERAKAE
jgi:hypothetical protein